MPVAPSFDDLLTQYEAEALLVRPTLKFLEGDVTTAQQHGAGAMADACIRFVVQAFKETFIDGAKGDALSALVDDHLNIQRSPATPAQATCSFTRTGGGAGGTLPTGFVVGSAFDLAGNTVLYTLDGDVTFTSGDNGPHTRSVTAQLSGRAGNVAAGLITRVVSSTTLTGVAVTNAATAGGGNEEETDDELKVRARNFWQTLRRGTLGALEFGALRIVAVRIARATEDALGIVTLVVSDSDGNSTAQMIADVVREIENWRAAGSIVTIAGGVALIIDITAQLIGRAGVDTSVLGPIAAAAVAGRVRKQRQGEILYLDSVKAAAIAVDPDALEALVITALVDSDSNSFPLTDVTPTANQVIRPRVITIT